MPEENIALMAHLLRRAGFGANRDELGRYAAKGYEATVEEMLHPEHSPPGLDDDDLLLVGAGGGAAAACDGEQGHHERGRTGDGMSVDDHGRPP